MYRYSVSWGSFAVHTGLWFCSRVFSCCLQDASRARPEWGHWEITYCDMWSAALSVIMAQNNGRVLAVTSWERKGVHMVYKKPESPQNEQEPSGLMGLSFGARVRHWDQQFHLAAQPCVGGLYKQI